MDMTEKLQKTLDDAVTNSEIAGANLLILKNGKELLYTQSGYADIENKKAFERDTICRIYSMTKPITAAAVMILVERGLLELGKPLGDILPEFNNQTVWANNEKVPARRNILVKELLNMTSGLPYPGPDAAGGEVAALFTEADKKLGTKDALSTMEIAKRIGKCGLSFHPGEKWMYGTSADVLGAVVEKISGMSYGEFLKKELFEPLEMTDTAFYVPKDKRHRLAEVYEAVEEGVRYFKTNNLGIRYEQDMPPAFESGGAGLVSAIDDYAKFATMLIHSGSINGKQLLSPGTVRYLTSGKLLPWQQDSLWRSWEGMAGFGYSNLMRIMEEPGMAHYNTWKGEYGWDGWLGTYFCNSPQNGVTILLFCQRKDAGTLEVTKKIRNIIGANL